MTDWTPEAIAAAIRALTTAPGNIPERMRAALDAAMQAQRDGGVRPPEHGPPRGA